jgi:hypothetical protein
VSGTSLGPLYSNEVSFYGRLYAPTDSSGKPQKTITEAIHRSAVENLTAEIQDCYQDAVEARRKAEAARSPIERADYVEI